MPKLAWIVAVTALVLVGCNIWTTTVNMGDGNENCTQEVTVDQTDGGTNIPEAQFPQMNVNVGSPEFLLPTATGPPATTQPARGATAPVKDN